MKPLFKYLLLATVLYTALFFTFNYIVPFNPGSITADSGWDSDYDSGGSWDYSESSYDSSYSGGGGYMSIGVFFIILFFSSTMVGGGVLFGKYVKNSDLAVLLSLLLVFLLMMISLFLGIEIIDFLIGYGIIIHILLLIKFIKYIKRRNLLKSKECSDEELESIGIKDSSKLKEELYKSFIDIQNSWMNFDYDNLAKLCSDELYNSYKSDLEVLKLKNGKNIMSNFNFKSMKIISAIKDEEKITIGVLLNVTFNDYVINEKTDKVIRGKKNTIMDNTYKLEYVKYNTTITECPSCGVKLEESSNKKCSHCGSVIVHNTKNYVLTHKERI